MTRFVKLCANFFKRNPDMREHANKTFEVLNSFPNNSEFGALDGGSGAMHANIEGPGSGNFTSSTIISGVRFSDLLPAEVPVT